jgi:hypothetical protein
MAGTASFAARAFCALPFLTPSEGASSEASYVKQQARPTDADVSKREGPIICIGKTGESRALRADRQQIRANRAKTASAFHCSQAGKECELDVCS